MFSGKSSQIRAQRTNALLTPAFSLTLMERSDLLIAFLAFGAAVSTLVAWLWSSLGNAER
jgi:hypothetical protein